MFTKLWKCSLVTIVVLLIPACGGNTLEIPMAPTERLPATSTAVPPLTARITPTYSFNVSPSALPALIPAFNNVLTSEIHSVFIPGRIINHLVVDDKYIYWTTEGGGSLFRYALDSSKNSYAATITSTQFEKGQLQSYPDTRLVRAGNWLIFDDRQITLHTHTWALDTFDIANQTKQILAQSQNSDNLFSFSSDGAWAAWSTMDLSANSIIYIENLQTRQRSELIRSVGFGPWEQVVVSAGRLAATRLLNEGKGGRALYLFDLKSGQGNQVYVDMTGSTMDGLTFNDNLIAWKSSTNYQGTTVLYDLQTGSLETISALGNDQIAPLLAGQWLTWDASFKQPLLLYNLDKQQGFIAAQAQPDDNLSCAVIHADVIAWCRVHSNSPDHSSFDSTVEWRTLP